MVLLENKKARLEYEVLQTYSAGIVLSGGEVKSLRNKSGSLTGSYVKVVGGEVVLLNAQITPYKFADNRDYDPKQTRKLLLKKKEIETLAEAIEIKGHTLVPLSFELVGRVIKLKFGIARGKKQYERRSELKKKAIQRDIEREVRDKVRIR
jgi:SsrA-binding protein